MPVLYFLVVYLPLESLLLKYLPVSGFFFQILRQIPDITVFALFFCVLVAKSHGGNGVKIPHVRIDVFVCLLIFIAFINSIYTPTANFALVVFKFKAIFRYVLLVYIVVNLHPSNKQLTRLFNLFLLSVAIQFFFGILQYFGGITVRDLIAARNTEAEVFGVSKTFTGDRFERVNDLMGTLGDTISFSFFLLYFNYFLLSVINKRAFTFVLIAFNAVFVYLSGSFSSTVAVFLSFIAYKIISGGIRLVVILKWVSLGFVFLLVVYFILPLDIKLQFHEFILALYEGAKNSRLGLIVFGVPAYFSDLRFLFGFSLDKFVFADYLKDIGQLPFILDSVIYFIIDDVYWFAFMIYFGVVGLVIYLLLLFSIIRSAISTSREASLVCCSTFLGRVNVSQLVALSLVMLFWLNGINQASEVRSYSFFLWLFVGVYFHLINNSKVKV